MYYKIDKKRVYCNTLFIIKWWPKPGSNWRHKDFQSFALPTELSGQQMAEPTGIEPAISSVTGRHVNHYTMVPLVAGKGFEPMTSGL